METHRPGFESGTGVPESVVESDNDEEMRTLMTVFLEGIPISAFAKKVGVTVRHLMDNPGYLKDVKAMYMEHALTFKSGGTVRDTPTGSLNMVELCHIG